MIAFRKLQTLTLLGATALATSAQAKDLNPLTVQLPEGPCLVPSQDQMLQWAGDLIRIQDNIFANVQNMRACPAKKEEFSNSLKVLLNYPEPVPVELRVMMKGGKEKTIRLKKPKRTFGYYYSDTAPSDVLIQQELKANGIDPLTVRWIKPTALVTNEELRKAAEAVKRKKERALESKQAAGEESAAH